MKFLHMNDMQVIYVILQFTVLCVNFFTVLYSYIMCVVFTITDSNTQPQQTNLISCQPVAETYCGGH